MQWLLSRNFNELSKQRRRSINNCIIIQRAAKKVNSFPRGIKNRLPYSIKGKEIRKNRFPQLYFIICIANANKFKILLWSLNFPLLTVESIFENIRHYSDPELLKFYQLTIFGRNVLNMTKRSTINTEDIL